MTGGNVVIVGGGTIGLAIAEQLARRGARPVVIDRQAFAGEASWASSGFLDLRVASERGDAFFGLCELSCGIYPDWTAALHRDSGLDPEYCRSQSFDLVYSDDDERAVQDVERNLARYGVAGEWLAGDEARRREPALSPDLRCAFFLDHPAQVRPPRLNRALLAYLRDAGATLVEDAEVLGFAAAGGAAHQVKTTRGCFTADQLILAAGPWSGIVADRLGVSVPVRPIRGQALMIRHHPRLLRHILFGFNWYVVPRRDGRIFVGSTVEDAGFVKCTTPFGMQKLSRLAIQSLPCLAGVRIEGSWSGLRPGSPDGRPYLGRLPGYDNVWIAAGHFTHGIVLAAATGRVMAQAVLGQSTDVDLAPFAVDRPLPAAGTGALNLSFAARAAGDDPDAGTAAVAAGQEIFPAARIS